MDASEQQAAATALSYLFAVTLSIVSLAVLMFGTRISALVKSAGLTFNPLVAAVQITSDVWFAELPPIRGNPLWQNHLILFGAVAVLLLAVTAFRVHRIFRRRD